MTDDDYRTALAAAIEEYERLGGERRVIDDRLAQLTETIGTLSRLVGLTPNVPLGLTDALRLVYRNAGIPLSPTEARERLRGIGFDFSTYSNDMAAIHTVLKRLYVAGELTIPSAPGKHLYSWQTPPKTVAVGPEVAEFIREHGRFHTDAPSRPRRGKTR